MAQHVFKAALKTASHVQVRPPVSNASQATHFSPIKVNSFALLALVLAVHALKASHLLVWLVEKDFILPDQLASLVQIIAQPVQPLDAQNALRSFL